MKQSVRFVRLYCPSFEEIPDPRTAFVKRLSMRVFLAVLAMVALYGILECALRLRGW